MHKFHWLSMVSLVIGILLTQSASARELVGWLESVTINSVNLKLDAKLDTGAKTTSLGYSSIQFFQRGRQPWVRVGVSDKKNRTAILEKRIVRTVTIKQHLGEAPHRRPVIMLGICLKHTYKTVEVDLMDRKGFNYTLLLGRNFLANDFVVDAAAKFTQQPQCTADSGHARPPVR